jgi:hypothetical protein
MKIWQKYLGVEDAEIYDYHRLARREMIDLFSSPRKRVVEIGCSAGYTGKYCKEKFPSVEYWGFELSKAAAKEALLHLDKVVCGKFEDQQLDILGLAPHSVDGVVLGDVLEHMYDPWRVLVSLLPWLSEDAEVVVSLPNVRNLWLLNEIAEGRFTYDQHGLLDITHLRFFTVNEIQELMNSTGYSIATGSFIIDERLQDYLAAGDGKTGPCVFHYRSISLKSRAELLSELCAKQFLFRAVPKKTALRRTSAPPSNLLKSLISDHDASQERDPVAYVDQLPLINPGAGSGKPECPVYAFYLPQFHPTPENSQWWGEGFTEWTNVTRAKPAFNGHYQPRHPGALGFYDLRIPEILDRQVALAKQAGIAGFAFYYYWFSGKTMLDMPLRQFMARHDALQMPFFVMWCNENWKRTWLGGSETDGDLLMEHKHLPDDPERFIDDLEDVLKHPGYLRVDGKPLLLVYPLLGREGADGDPAYVAQIVGRWRAHARKLGIGELCIGAFEWPYVLNAGGFLSAKMLDVDFFFEFPPNHVWNYAPVPNVTSSYHFYQEGSKVTVAHYEDLVQRSRQLAPPPWPLVKTVIAGSWDNSARSGPRANVYHGATPALYEDWLRDSMQYATARPAVPGHPMVFVNAWNEWAEGAYLEPDKRYGYAYLAATQRATSGLPAVAPEKGSVQGTETPFVGGVRAKAEQDG